MLLSDSPQAGTTYSRTIAEVSGLPMDLIHAVATVIFLLMAAEPMLEKLDRIKVKYGLVE